MLIWQHHIGVFAKNLKISRFVNLPYQKKHHWILLINNFNIYLFRSTLRRSNCRFVKVIRVVWIENKSFPAIEGFPLQPWCSSVSGSDPNWGAAPRKKFSGAKIIAEFINFDLLLLLKIKTNVKEYALVGPWGQKEGDPASWWFK